MRRMKYALDGAAIGLIMTIALGVFPAEAVVVKANGVCLAASCANSVLGENGSTSTSFGGGISVNHDPFQITGLVAASNSLGLTVAMEPQFTIKYVGSGAVTKTDVINLVLTQQFVNLAAVSLGSFFYEVEGSFGGTAGAGTSMATNNIINGNPVGVSIVTAPGPFINFGGPVNLDGPLVNPLTDTFDYTLTVTAGTLPGFFVEVAEPGSIYLLLGAGLMALGAASRRIRRIR